METQATKLAPAPGKESLALLVYNIVYDNKQLNTQQIWESLPKELRVAHQKKRLLRCLSNMTYNGVLINLTPGTKFGHYAIAPYDHWETKQERVVKPRNRAYKRRAHKRKASKKVAASANGNWKSPVLQRIDKQVSVLEHRLADLKAARDILSELDA